MDLCVQVLCYRNTFMKGTSIHLPGSDWNWSLIFSIEFQHTMHPSWQWMLALDVIHEVSSRGYLAAWYYFSLQVLIMISFRIHLQWHESFCKWWSKVFTWGNSSSDISHQSYFMPCHYTPSSVSFNSALFMSQPRGCQLSHDPKATCEGWNVLSESSENC